MTDLVRDALHDAMVTIEALHHKFTERGTGCGNAALAKLHLALTQHDDNMALLRERPTYQSLRAVTTTDDIAVLANGVVRLAEDIGVVVTVEQRAKTPLAMGHAETVVSVRPARKAA